ncbi:MAG: 30S ribosomal protein S9 [Deltaproteobacteria bacterium CG_4_10_14_0_2_um_filter_43_8]|nr:MAG: 30S ribosomal protein S9 [Deltaproteobacteria bacterium CG11_big_fil_rev_8_21_14_0_20_42_23]PJA18749.1 MAG: 30S ribosomal protein S9 [Deltaproteobacteria bacterium CG_4_10_14_0_2_um_filter_43_8]PJC64383.1 MAG: 30S ribosomal protein S9 [Deltaproteobacteria bacterium CG_4_9_14_0_2_um_filter_42_21]
MSLTAKDKKKTEFLATGRRKTSIARVRVSPGEGTLIVNKRPIEEYFGRKILSVIANQPFVVTGTTGKFDAMINVDGGGLSGQAAAVRHGIARALINMNPDLRKPLKVNGYLTRDAREKERRKVGHRKARKSPQFSKR